VTFPFTCCHKSVYTLSIGPQGLEHRDALNLASYSQCFVLRLANRSILTALQIPVLVYVHGGKFIGRTIYS